MWKFVIIMVSDKNIYVHAPVTPMISLWIIAAANARGEGDHPYQYLTTIM